MQYVGRIGVNAAILGTKWLGLSPSTCQSARYPYQNARFKDVIDIVWQAYWRKFNLLGWSDLTIQFLRAICVCLVARFWVLVVCNKKPNPVLAQIPVAYLNQDRRRFAVDSFFIRELLCPKLTVFNVWPKLQCKLECIREIFARITE